MARHFGAQHAKSGYAAMGGAMGRPIYKGMNAKRSVAEAIAHERNKAAKAHKISSGKKK